MFITKSGTRSTAECIVQLRANVCNTGLTPHFLPRSLRCRFDEWLDADRVVRKDDEGLKLMQQLQAKSDKEAPKGKAAASKRKNEASDESESEDGRRKKRKSASAEEEEDSLESVLLAP